MLDLRFFRSASFSVGTAAVSVAFFALLGGLFALTQYLQFVHGYSAIEAGAIMSPIALGLMIGAGSSSKATERLGTSRVVAVGLAGLATMLALTTLWSPQTRALTLALWFFGLALAMGWVMAPATDAVVGAVSAAKSGVASATNAVARMVSGALGVAVIGSLINSLYSNDLDGSLAALPAQAQAARRTRSALPARSPPSSHTMPPRSCSQRQATLSPRRWASASPPPQRSRPPWPSSCSASYRLASPSTFGRRRARHSPAGRRGPRAPQPAAAELKGPSCRPGLISVRFAALAAPTPVATVAPTGISPAAPATIAGTNEALGGAGR